MTKPLLVPTNRTEPSTENLQAVQTLFTCARVRVLVEASVELFSSREYVHIVLGTEMVAEPLDHLTCLWLFPVFCFSLKWGLHFHSKLLIDVCTHWHFVGLEHAGTVHRSNRAHQSTYELIGWRWAQGTGARVCISWTSRPVTTSHKTALQSSAEVNKSLPSEDQLQVVPMCQVNMVPLVSPENATPFQVTVPMKWNKCVLR